MPFDLSGHVALVTGSTTGLGKAIARGLGRAGAKVAVSYFRNSQRAEKTLAELQAAGCQARLYCSDASDPAEVEKLIKSVTGDLGPIDILVPNATPDQPQMPIEQFTWQHYQTMIDFFIKSPYLLT